MRISEVAERTCLSVDTLRFYEKIGLIDPPPRDAGGRRAYEADVLGWIGFLVQLNATGMKQADRVRYADLRRQGAVTYAKRREMLEDHRTQVAARLEALQATLALLDRKVAQYHALEQEAADV